MRVVAVLLAMLGVASAFQTTPVRSHTRVIRQAAVPQMGMKEDMAKVGAVAATLAASPMVASATEGTNEIFGIDDDRIYFILPVLVAVNVLFNSWAQDQDNEDFFDSLPPPPK